MNQFIARNSGTIVAAIFDDVELHALVMDTISFWLRAGLEVKLLSDDGYTPAMKPEPVKTPTPAIVAPKLGRPASKKHSPRIVEVKKWAQGDTVYLVWSALTADARIVLSSYRNAKGVVDQFRGGAGVQKTVGVKFNNDPKPVWLRPSEINNVPEV